MELSARLPLVLISSFCFLSLTSSVGTPHGRARLEERQKRAAAGYQGKYAAPTLPYSPNMNAYAANTPQASQYQVPYNPAAATPYRQYGSSAANAQQNPAGMTAAQYGANPAADQYAYNPASAYARQPVAAAAYPTAGSSYPAGAYPMGQPTGQQYPYQAAGSTPAQYGYGGGYNPYAQQQQQQPNTGYGMGGYSGYNGGQGRSAIPVVTTPSPEQFVLADFCKKQDKEPLCKRNSFAMCDSQDNYPSEAATLFYGYFKAQITAMSTDYDYANSDQYDTGFATQQNKLIDFVHDIFQDNEFGNLPGVPPPKKGLCVSESDTFAPGWAKTSRGKHLVIMNSNTVKQTIRADVCKNAGKGCQNVPKCYRSECRQRFRYDTMLAFDPCDPRKPPRYELFKIPDGCECFVIVDEPDLSNMISTPVAESPKRMPPKAPSGRAADVLTTPQPETTTTPSPSTTSPATAAIPAGISSTLQSATTEPSTQKQEDTATTEGAEGTPARMSLSPRAVVIM